MEIAPINPLIQTSKRAQFIKKFEYSSLKPSLCYLYRLVFQNRCYLYVSRHKVYSMEVSSCHEKLTRTDIAFENVSYCMCE